MPTLPPTLTPAPASPNKANRATYDALSIGFDDYIRVSLVPQTQAAVNSAYNNAVESNTSAINAAASATSAVAAANFKGNWSALTGALNMPASVAHNGNFWALNTNLANVTTATPGVSASWTSLQVGAGGALESSSAVDITLTAASFKVQSVTMTAADKSVTMPSAITLPAGGEIFVIKNTGSVVFCVRDSAGTLLTTVDLGQTVLLYLTNNVTAAGVWAVSNSAAAALAQSIYQATALNVNAAAATCLTMTAMSATQAIVVWGTSTGMFAATLNLTGNSIAAGATLSLLAVANVSAASVCTMSATQAVLTHHNGSGGVLQAYTLNVSGTTLTAGATLTVSGATAVNFVSVASLSSTQAICVYRESGTNSQAVTLNVSGTTLTAGALLLVHSGTAFKLRVVAVSSVQAVFVQATTAGLTAQTLNVSGTTITSGAVLNVVALDLTQLTLAPNSATTLVLSYLPVSPNPPSRVFRELYVTGTTCSVGPATLQLVSRDSVSFLPIGLAKVSATKFAMISPSDRGDGTFFMMANALGLSESVLSLGPPALIKTSQNANVAADILAIASMSANRQLAVYRDPSGFVQARVLEIGA